jgi:hypothetical protein
LYDAGDVHVISRISTVSGMAAFGLLGMVLVVFPAILHGKIPGDLADGRFNEYLLEHFYQWVTGKAASFWSADFFYPFPLTIAFSDNHLGNGVIFAAFRMLGFSVGDAFRGWYALAFVFNFAACAYVLTRLGYGRLAAAAGAFLFSFGLPVTAQESHVQLFYRFGVPLAVLGLIEFAAQGRRASLLAILFWTVWQFYCSIYIGYFLSLLLIALAVSIAIFGNGFAFSAIAFWPHRFRLAWTTASRADRAIWSLGMLTLAGLLIALFVPYFQVSRLYGFRRSVDEIDSMLPRLASYVFSSNSRLWRFSWSGFGAIPMLHEHAMFVGIAPFLAIAIAIVLRVRKSVPGDRHFAPMAASILLLFVLTLFVANHSLYAVLVHVPGANAIRAVSRISTVLLFPFAALLASGLDALIRLKRPVLISRGLATAIIALMVIECSYVRHYVSDEQDWLNRLTALEARLPRDMPSAPILMVAYPAEGGAYVTEVDAMLLAQQRGWQSLNGYSGSKPSSYAFTDNCQDAAINIVNGLQFLHRNSEEAYRNMAQRTVRVGYGDCDTASLMQRPSLTSFAGPLPAEAMAKVTVAVNGARRVDDMLEVTLSVRNDGPAGIPAISTTGTPVRLSVKYIAPGDSPSDVAIRNSGWDLRQDISVDIPAGETRRFDFMMTLPPQAGVYRLAASLVQEYLVWFHDRGMPIAISRQTVIRDGSFKRSLDGSVKLDGSIRIGE